MLISILTFRVLLLYMYRIQFPSSFTGNPKLCMHGYAILGLRTKPPLADRNPAPNGN